MSEWNAWRESRKEWVEQNKAAERALLESLGKWYEPEFVIEEVTVEAIVGQTETKVEQQ